MAMPRHDISRPLACAAPSVDSWRTTSPVSVTSSDEVTRPWHSRIVAVHATNTVVSAMASVSPNARARQALAAAQLSRTVCAGTCKRSRSSGASGAATSCPNAMMAKMTPVVVLETPCSIAAPGKNGKSIAKYISPTAATTRPRTTTRGSCVSFDMSR